MTYDPFADKDYGNPFRDDTQKVQFTITFEAIVSRSKDGDTEADEDKQCDAIRAALLRLGYTDIDINTEYI